MKKILLCTAAFAGLAFVAPAQAADDTALQLGVGGYVRGYAAYTDQDEVAGQSLRKIDFRKDTEVNLDGSVTLDNGWTAGATLVLLGDKSDGGSTVEQSYMTLGTSWGQFVFGETNGAAYRLQVTAPSADDAVDGYDPDINTIDFDTLSSTGGLVTGDYLGYAQDMTTFQNKLSYFTPSFNGFQAGVTFTPGVSAGNQSGLAGVARDDTAGELDYAYELAARYEGSFDAIDVALGAGYGIGKTEEDAAAVTAVNSDDREQFNVGANVGFSDFGLGVSYLDDNNGVQQNGDTTTWVAGADYTMGAYKLGLSYLDRTDEANSPANPGGITGDSDTTRWTGGVVYEWGPGLTFRGAISYVDFQTDQAADTERDAYQVTLGTQLNF